MDQIKYIFDMRQKRERGDGKTIFQISFALAKMYMSCTGGLVWTQLQTPLPTAFTPTRKDFMDGVARITQSYYYTYMMYVGMLMCGKYQ